MIKSNSLLNTLLQAKIEDDKVITFYFFDNTSRSQDIKKELFFDDKNKELPLYKVIQKINDISHDLGAERFEIN